jgi:hypothetical protein
METKSSRGALGCSFGAGVDAGSIVYTPLDKYKFQMTNSDKIQFPIIKYRNEGIPTLVLEIYLRFGSCYLVLALISSSSLPVPAWPVSPTAP